MGKALVIGSTVCDVLVYVDQLPQREGDAHIRRQVWSVGGCAFNVARILHSLSAPYAFITPVGTGVYANFIRHEMDKIGMTSSITLDGTNGCCYCFIEADGERTFLSDHGVEYSFDAAWLENAAVESFDYIYLCGLEVEEPTGVALVEAVASLTGQVIFAPGPRGLLIPPERLKTVYQLSPILHVNEQEALAFSGQQTVAAAAQQLFAQTQNLVLITQGEKGALAYDGQQFYQANSYPAQVVDTVGAGDSHIAAFLAARLAGRDITVSLDFANLVASKIVASSGVQLTAAQCEELGQKCKTRKAD